MVKIKKGKQQLNINLIDVAGWVSSGWELAEDLTKEQGEVVQVEADKIPVVEEPKKATHKNNKKKS